MKKQLLFIILAAVPAIMPGCNRPGEINISDNMESSHIEIAASSKQTIERPSETIVDSSSHEQNTSSKGSVVIPDDSSRRETNMDASTNPSDPDRESDQETHRESEPEQSQNTISEHSSEAESHSSQNNEASKSLISVPLENEPIAIQRAPEYDIEEARTYINRMSDIRKTVSSIPDDDSLVAFGSYKPTDEAMLKLQHEIDKLSEGDHQVSLVMIDVRTASGVSYRSTQKMCTQSTVKAPYVAAVLEKYPDALSKNGDEMRKAIEFSDNEAYEALRSVYGSEPIAEWCRQSDVDESFAYSSYPRNHTARDMLKLWTRLYTFFNSGADSENFARYYAASSCSAASKQLGSRYPLQTKAGWECGLDEYRNYDPSETIPSSYRDQNPANDECAINDSGIIYTKSGPYLFVIYTDHPFGVFPDYTFENPLYDLTEALLNVRNSFSDGA